MPFRLKPAFWLKAETDRVEGIVTMEKYWKTTWTAETLRETLEGLGMHYTVQQIEEIGAELISRGVLEAVS